MFLIKGLVTVDERKGEQFRWTVEKGNLNVFQFEGTEIVWSKTYAEYLTAVIDRCSERSEHP